MDKYFNGMLLKFGQCATWHKCHRFATLALYARVTLLHENLMSLVEPMNNKMN